MDEKYFGQFKIVMVAQARAYEIEEVFDPDYKPTNVDDKTIFFDKQKFACAVC